MPTPLQILCTGDLHLGRYPSRIPSGRRELSVEQVWEDLVTYAVRQDIDVVALTGDVVDNENVTYESFGPLQRGLGRLDEAEIATVAVAGNHDYDALPRIDSMAEASRFYLLGRGGQWEETTVEPEGSTPVQFVGWSFRDAYQPESPLGNFRGDIVEPGMPTVGLLHAEVGAEESVYAPVSTDKLQRQPVSAWLLGHIHKPQILEETAPPVLYPGSPQPLDPSETGAHGPRLVEIGPDGNVAETPLPRATIRYEVVEVDVEGVEDAEGVEEAAADVLRERLQEMLQSHSKLQRLVCRLQLTGRTPAHRQIEDLASGLAEGLEVPVGEAVASIDRAEVQTRPDLDLERIAEGSDPPAVLAALLREIDAGKETGLTEETWTAVKEALGPVLRSPAYEPLRSTEQQSYKEQPYKEQSYGRNELKEAVRRQGLLLLDELLKQTEDTDNHR